MCILRFMYDFILYILSPFFLKSFSLFLFLSLFGIFIYLKIKKSNLLIKLSIKTVK